MRIMFLLPALLIPLSPVAAQQEVVHAPAHSTVISFVTRDPPSLSAAGMVELRAERKLSVTGGVVGAVVGAAVGGALACLANRDHYGVYCAGQSDTKVVIGAVIGAGVGGWIGAVVWGRRR